MSNISDDAFFIFSKIVHGLKLPLITFTNTFIQDVCDSENDIFDVVVNVQHVEQIFFILVLCMF